MIELSITLGLIFSLFSYEVFGLAAGGLVVPGYISLLLTEPLRLSGLLLVSFITYYMLKAIGNVMFLYGRRQMVLSLLIGCILANVSRQFFMFSIGSTSVELQAVGWVIPGLIAHWFLKQGIFKTLCALTINSVLVKLLSIILLGLFA